MADKNELDEPLPESVAVSPTDASSDRQQSDSNAADAVETAQTNHNEATRQRTEILDAVTGRTEYMILADAVLALTETVSRFTPRDEMRAARKRLIAGVAINFLATLLVVAAGGLLFRHQQRAIAHAASHSCQIRNERVVKLNRTFDGLAKIEETNPYTGANIGKRRIAAYRAARFNLERC